jgi:hypothetical protein
MAGSDALIGFFTGAAIDVRLIGGDHHFPVPATLTALAALASPIVSFGIARYVTSRTINNEKGQRALDREQEWLKQLQDRQLTSSADFGAAAFRALVAAERLNPIYGEPTDERLRESRHLLETARQEMPKVQLLFQEPRARPASIAGQSLIDLLDTAQKELETRQREEEQSERATAQGKYATAAEQARPVYQTFVQEVADVLAVSPEAASQA